MSVIGDLVDGALGALAAAGVAATADPDLVGQMVAAHGAVAVVLPPEVEGRSMGGSLDARLDVMLLGAPPGGLAQFQAIWDSLLPTMDALHIAEAVRATFAFGRLTYPGYLLSTQTST